MENGEKHTALTARADRYIREAWEKKPSDPWRLNYHFTPPAGWMNDPNGLIQYKGEYHLFYQYYPYDTQWGPMHWGHAKSPDCIRWEHLPVALAPSEPYDAGGCWSGSAVDDHGTLTLVYSGNVGAEFDDGKGQRQCIAFSKDGIRFEKYEGNPVIAGIPPEGSHDFRDPKVWKHDGSWYAVVGSGKDGTGKALLYQSTDLRKWIYRGVAAQSDSILGTMWECPDLFPLGDRHVLIVSPMWMQGHKNLYLLGDMDYETGRFTRERYAELDFGPDFYAAQTFLDDRGRRILIGWMTMWGTKMPTQAMGWAGAMTLPRVLELSGDGTLLCRPLPELAELRGIHERFENLRLDPGGDSILEHWKGDSLEIELEMAAEPSGGLLKLELRRSADGTEKTVVSYNPQTCMLSLDRSHSGQEMDGIFSCRLQPAPGSRVRLHVFLDRSSVEIFGNDGRAVLSARIYPGPDNLGLRLYCEKGAVEIRSLDIWGMHSA